VPATPKSRFHPRQLDEVDTNSKDQLRKPPSRYDVAVIDDLRLSWREELFEAFGPSISGLGFSR
jgi:hypothetical protein